MKVTIKKTKSSGSFEKWLKHSQKLNWKDVLNDSGKTAELKLKAATPVDSGQSKDSWRYVVQGNRLDIINSYIPQGATKPLVLMINYGHGTRGGSFVAGTNFMDAGLKDVITLQKVKEVIDGGK